MRFEYRFCLSYQADLIKLLEIHEIHYRLSGTVGDYFSNGTPVPVFVIFGFKQHTPLIDELSRKYRCRPQVRVVYSAKEINSAQLLWMTPKKQSIEIANSYEALSFSCTWVDSRGTARSHHKEQVALFGIKKEPSAKTKTAFWSSSTGFSEVFTDWRVKELVESSNLHGVDFLPTIVAGGSHSNNIFQLTTSNKVCSDYIVFGKGEKEICCPMCGKKQYAFNDTYQLHLDVRGIELNEDLFMTDRIFGEGIARPLYLVSQRFYRLLKTNGLTSNVSFDPVIIV